MSSKPRGRVIILNNENFDRSTEPLVRLLQRQGSCIDVLNLEKLFRELGFEISFWSDLTAQEILDNINLERKKPFHDTADAFVFIVLSHGTRGAIYGTDGVKVHINRDIVAAFDGEKCPRLVNKPKLFFFQACQGNETTAGSISESECSTSDSMEEDILCNDGITDDEQEQRSNRVVHEKADVIVSHSTVPGYKSWRNKFGGSWFIQALVKNINEYAHEHDIHFILSKVNSQMSLHAAKPGGYIQICKYECTFRKSFYFLPKYYVEN